MSEIHATATPNTTEANAASSESGVTASAAPEGEGKRELTSGEDIVSALEAMERSGEEQPGAAPKSTASLADAEEEETGDGEDASTAEENSAQESAVPVPASWKAEEKDLFLKLPPELQTAVASREAERERYVNAKAQEAAEIRKAHEEAQRQFSERWRGMDIAVKAAQVAVEGEYAGIDWLALQQEDPVTFMRLDAQRKQRLMAVQQALEASQILEQERSGKEFEQLQKHLLEQKQAIAPKLQSLFPNTEPGKIREDMREYLQGLGAPDEHIKGITHGYMLELAAKAMLYDRQKQALAAAEKKVAEAPKVQKAKARFDTGGPDPTAAREQLRRGGSSTENIIKALGIAGF